ncbi:MAG: GWxTD domain-containing protein [Rhodothermales bacterium]
MNRSLQNGFAVAALLVLLASSAGAQDLPIQIDVDHAAFAYSEEASLVEIYLGVGATSLDFEAEDGGFTAELPLTMQIVRSATTDLEEATVEPVWTDSIPLVFALADTSVLDGGQHFIHQIRTAVPPGEYELRMRVPETDDRPELELRRDMLVMPYEEGSAPQLSDLTLASEIVQSSDQENPFYKNGLIIRPSANHLFGEGMNQLYYYAESYRAEAIEPAEDDYTVYTYVSDANRPAPVDDLEKRQDRAVRSPDVLVGSFDTGDLPTGSYFLHMALLNEDNEAVVEQSRKFFVYNPDVEREQPAAVEMDFETSPYATMSEEEVEQGLAHVQVIASDNERRRMRRLPDIEAERRFLMEFWRSRDDSPRTPINEVKEEFYQRLQYANDRYSSAREDGWRSDRGRVVMKYGLPNNIEPNLYDRNTVPHEIWQYNNIPGEGQATFVFADRTGFGRFELIHSTVPGERSLPNWRTELSGR